MFPGEPGSPGMHEITGCWLKLTNGRKVEVPEVAISVQDGNYGRTNADRTATVSATSLIAIISRAECILHSGAPTSTVVMPNRVAVSGPIVEPHGMLLFDTKSW